MELGDEPQFGLQVTPSSFLTDEPQDVLVSHPRNHEDVSLILPRLLVLSGGREDMKGSSDMPAHGRTVEQEPGLCTWMEKTFTATNSFRIWAFHTRPKRPLAFTSSSCKGFRPSRGEAGGGPGSWRTCEDEGGTSLNMVVDHHSLSCDRLGLII